MCRPYFCRGGKELLPLARECHRQDDNTQQCPVSAHPLRLIQDDPVVRAWYGKKVARDGGKMKNKAVIAVVRKLVKGLWHVAQGEPFDSRLLFDTSKLDLLKA